MSVKDFVVVENGFRLYKIYITASAGNTTILEAKVTTFNYYYGISWVVWTLMLSGCQFFDELG